MGGQVNYLSLLTTGASEAYRATEVTSHAQYLGWADPGTLNGATTGWKICKVEYNSDDTTVTSITWPSGSRNYSFEWDERASYTYS